MSFYRKKIVCINFFLIYYRTNVFLGVFNLLKITKRKITFSYLIITSCFIFLKFHFGLLFFR